MYVQLYFIVVLSFGAFATNLKIGTPCVTPNGSNGTCVPYSECEVISTAVSRNSPGAAKFAQESQCGYDKEPLVCCGTSEHPKIDINLLFTQTPTISSTPQPHVEVADFSDTSICGLEVEDTYRIKGGTIADFQEFPWMAALEYKSKLDDKSVGIRCGGSIITKRYVLTAAHCIIHIEFVVTNAWLGASNIASDKNCLNLTGNLQCAESVQIFKIEKRIPHELYDKLNSYNDIGLLLLEKDVEFNDYIRPICLTAPHSPLPNDGTYMTVAGWGFTENHAPSNVKLKVQIPVRSNSICNKILQGKNKTLTSNQLCVGGEPGRDSCQGDSGGPLMTNFQNVNEEVQWVQEGIVSYGVGCGRNEHPAVYTRIAAYKWWILNKIENKNTCFTPNKEPATCISIRNCKVIIDALRTRSTANDSIPFVKQSQCGYETEPLVCCGSVANFLAKRSNRTSSTHSKIPLITFVKWLPPRSICGKVKEEDNVFGGVIANFQEYPWVAALEYKHKRTGENVGVKCSGSVITNQYILTAAHCLYNQEFSLVGVRLGETIMGEWNVTSDPDCSQQQNQKCADPVQNFTIQRIIPHPSYSNETGYNDIALIRLQQNITYTGYIHPICLPPTNLPSPKPLSKLKLSGWGFMENNTEAPSDVKFKLEVSVRSNELCQEKLNKTILLNQLCVEDEKERKSCPGYLGGPLMRIYQDQVTNLSNWFLDGVMSHNAECGKSEHTTVYSRVSSFVNWIISTISEK